MITPPIASRKQAERILLYEDSKILAQILLTKYIAASSKVPEHEPEEVPAEVETQEHEPSVFGRRLKAFRHKLGISQNELAKRSGVTRVTITVLESGRQQGVSLEVAMKLADGLGISIDRLARDDGI